jgi:hypothetical protein
MCRISRLVMHRVFLYIIGNCRGKARGRDQRPRNQTVSVRAGTASARISSMYDEYTGLILYLQRAMLGYDAG